MEPMAARACPNPEGVDAAHERLTYFTRGAEWSDRDVRGEAARDALAAMTARGPVMDWMMDDTGFPRQGTHSMNVQRRYSGTIGKIASCQVAASLAVATRTERVPVDFALYLPESWTEDPSRRAEAHIPEEVTFKTKPELGIEMIERAVADGLPAGLVLTDSAYGDNSEFRRHVHCEGLDYAVGLHRTTTVWRLNWRPGISDRTHSPKELINAHGSGGAWELPDNRAPRHPVRVTSLLRTILAMRQTRVVGAVFGPFGLGVDVAPTTRLPRCLGCRGTRRRVYDRSSRTWRHRDFGGMEATLRYELRRVDCHWCGKSPSWRRARDDSHYAGLRRSRRLCRPAH